MERSSSDTRLDRTDRKNATYPYKARDKLVQVAITTWKNFVKPAHLTTARQNYKVHQVDTLTEEIAALENTIQEKRLALNVLRMEEIHGRSQ